MVSSETQQKIITLGKQLVELLNRDENADTLTKWMAHYIAEKMVLAQNSTGKERAKAEEQCFATILRLWNHHSLMPRGHRPFEDFETLFETLSRLCPDESRFFYGGWEPEDQSQEKTELALLLDTIKATDRAARALLQSLTDMAVEASTDEQTQLFLESAMPGHVSKDLAAIQRMIHGTVEERDPRSERIALLKRRLEHLSHFTRLGAKVSKLVRAELATTTAAK